MRRSFFISTGHENGQKGEGKTMTRPTKEQLKLILKKKLKSREEYETQATLRLKHYWDVSKLIKDGVLPPLPTRFGNNLVPSTGYPMYYNDVLGCCGPAAAGHILQDQSAMGGALVTPTSAAILKVYEDVGGYVPADPNNPQSNSTDNGVDLLTEMEYLVKTGVTFNGVTYKLASFLQIDVTNQEEIYYAIYLLGALMAGIQCPDSALTQFEAGEMWTPVSDSPIDGGHAIDIDAVLTGPDENADPRCVTWGAEQYMSLAFLMQYIDEGYIPVFLNAKGQPIFINASGVTPAGFNWAQLQADMVALPNVSPTPPAPAAPTVTSIAVNPSPDTVAIGATVQLEATATMSDGTTQDITSTVTWQSANVDIATAIGGLVTGVAAGTVNVLAINGTVSGGVEVTVTAAPTPTPSPSNQIIGQVGNDVLQAFDKKITMDVAPVLLDVGGGGRVMVPVRFDAEARGDKVDWDEATKTFTITPAVDPTIKAELEAVQAELEAVKAELTAEKVAHSETQEQLSALEVARAKVKVDMGF